LSVVMYRRVSSADQRLDRQEIGPDVDKVFDDKASGKDRARPELDACLAYVREGDTLRVYSADRLARSLQDLIHLVDDLTGRGVRVEFVKEGLVFDPAAGDADPYARCLLQVLGAFAEMERAIIGARRDEGIALAKERGVYSGNGRPPKLTPAEVEAARARRALGVPLARVAKDFGVAKSTMSDALAGRGSYGSDAYTYADIL